MNLTLRYVVFFGIGIIGTLFGCVLWLARVDAPLPANVYLNDLSLKGLRVSQLAQPLEQFKSILQKVPVRVKGTQARSLPLAEWGLELDVEGTAQAVRAKRESIHPLERLFRKPTIAVQPLWQIRDKKFNARLKTLHSLERAPQNAKVEWKAGVIQIRQEQTGLELDTEGTRKNLLQMASTLSLQTPPEAIDLEPAFRPLTPKITREQLKPIKGVIATYTTRFPGYQVNRNYNIRLAAQVLNGLVLLPGERLSYNQTVGPRTGKQGFRLAPVIIRGEKRLGIGGGVCQVSSTLYNAALLADMKIVRRYNHSIPITYVPPGRDATVTDSLDLVIENNHPFPIAISTEVRHSSLVIRILGTPLPGRRVAIRVERLGRTHPVVRYVTDTHLPAGKKKVLKKGSPGYRVRVWRLVYENGKLVRRERVSVSTYRAEPRVVAVGPPAMRPQPVSLSTASSKQ